MDLSEANSTDSAGFEFFKLNFYPFYYSVMQCAPWKIIIFFCSLWKCWSIYIGVLQQKLQYSKMSAIPNEQKLLISFRFNIKKKSSRKSQLKASNDRMAILYFGNAIYQHLLVFVTFSLTQFLRASFYVWLSRPSIHTCFFLFSSVPTVWDFKIQSDFIDTWYYCALVCTSSAKVKTYS